MSPPHKPLKPSIASVAAPSFLSRSATQKRKSRASKATLTTADVSQADAIWFSRLPEKVKRGQFTVEEQILLTGKHETTAAPDAADELFYKLRGARGRGLPAAPNRSLPSLDSTHSSDTEDHPSDRDSPVTVTDDEMDAELMESFRWIDNDDPLDLALDDYHVHVAATAERPKTPLHRRPTYRRSRSIAGIALGLPSPTSPTKPSRSPIEQWGSGWGPAPKPHQHQAPLPTPPTTNFSHPAPTLAPAPNNPGSPKAPSGSLQQAGPKVTPVAVAKITSNATPSSTKAAPLPARRPSLDANAAHYLNPEARLKLRLYLATPSRFDEALEFGFPALNCPAGAPAHPPLKPARRPSTAGRPSPPVTQPPKTQVLPPTPEPPTPPEPRLPPPVTRPAHRRSRSLGSTVQAFFSSTSGSSNAGGLRTFLDDATATTTASSAVSAVGPTFPAADVPHLDLSPSPPPLGPRSRSFHTKEHLSISSLSSSAASDAALAGLVPGYYRRASATLAFPSVSSLQPSMLNHSADRPAPNPPTPLGAKGPTDNLNLLAVADDDGGDEAADGADDNDDAPHASSALLERERAPFTPPPRGLPSADTAPREMTLRMTLTRPDLRDADAFPDATDHAPLYVGPGSGVGAGRGGGFGGAHEAGLLKRGQSFKERMGKSLGLGGSGGIDGGVRTLPEVIEGMVDGGREKEEGGGLRRFLSRRW